MYCHCLCCRDDGMMLNDNVRDMDGGLEGLLVNFFFVNCHSRT